MTATVSLFNDCVILPTGERRAPSDAVEAPPVPPARRGRPRAPARELRVACLRAALQPRLLLRPHGQIPRHWLQRLLTRGGGVSL